MRVAIYARYSAGPRQSDQSIEGQVRVCEEYCKTHQHEVVARYYDRHISGRTDNRAEFQRMIEDSARGKFQAVLVYKTDRFARNKYDSAIYKRELARNGVKVLYAAEAIPDGPEGVILESLMEGLAEYYSLELAQKIKRGMRESALKCHTTGPGVPLGYKVAPDKSFEVDETEARAVRAIFEMYINKASKAEICDYLNAQGFKTHRGQPFNKNSVDRIIANDKYIGTYRYADIVIRDGIPAIVSPQTFFQAQEEREMRKARRAAPRPRANYALAGKLFCGLCGRPMTGISGTGKSGRKWYYYMCPSARSKSGCEKTVVKRDWVEDKVVELTTSFFNQPQRLAELSGMLEARLKEKCDTAQEIAFYESRLRETNKGIDNLVAACQEMGRAPRAFQERLDALEEEYAMLQTQLSLIKQRPARLSKDEIFALLQELFAQVMGDPVDYKARLIDALVSKVYLWEDKIVVYYNIMNPADPEEIELMGSPGSFTGGASAAPVEPLVVVLTSGFYIACAV